GAWYGATPQASEWLTRGWADDWRPVGKSDNPTAWVCPYLVCPECSGDLLWSKSDVTRDRERLSCAAKECGLSIDGAQLRLTRKSMKASPPDILFTTTESLNRQLTDSDSWRAFGIRTTP